MTEEVGLSGNIDLTALGEEIPLLGVPGTIFSNNYIYLPVTFPCLSKKVLKKQKKNFNMAFSNQR